jgi:hypothetical protein
MNEQLILHQLFLMPETLKQEVLHYMLYLASNYHKQTFTDFQQIYKSSTIRKPTFGSAKGKYVLSPDFDEPLEDFKEYME